MLLQEKIMQTESQEKVQITANLGTAYVLGKDILKMGEDDVLILDSNLNEGVNVVYNDRNYASGLMFFLNDKKAVLITSVNKL